MPKRNLRLVIPLLVLALLVSGFLVYRAWLTQRPFEWSGTIEARTISVGSRTGGRVKEVLVREGERVEAGRPLVVLEKGDLDAQRLMAEAQLSQTRAALEKLQHGARPEEIEAARARTKTAVAALTEAHRGARAEQVAAARARLAAAQATADKARSDDERERKLLESGAVAQAEVDTADTNLRAAVAQRDAAEAGLKELTNGVRPEEVAQASTRAEEARASAQLVEAGARGEDIRGAEAQVEAAKGRLDQVLVLIDELTIRAARAGRVETLDLRPGDILAPNATAAVLLEDDQLFVRIYVPETQIGHVRTGAEVPVFVDSFPNRSFKGVIEHVSQQGEYSPRNLQTADERANQVFAARVNLGDGGGELRAGMAAFIRAPR